MNEKLNALKEAISKNPALLERLEADNRPETILAIAKELGIELTAADFEHPPVEELTDDQLENAAGGGISDVIDKIVYLCGDWYCPACGTDNNTFRNECRNCGHPVYTGDWDCPSCSTRNTESFFRCKECGDYRRS